MRIDLHLRVEAPPAVVFRFYSQLDHLRFISVRHRHEWSPRQGVHLALGAEQDVRVQQHRHGISLRFRTRRLEPPRLIEDEFLTWPVHGARHRLSFEAVDGGKATELENVLTWEPPWYLKSVLARHAAEQTRFFEERHQNAKRFIEAAYRERGDAAFVDGVLVEAERLQLAPVVPL